MNRLGVKMGTSFVPYRSIVPPPHSEENTPVNKLCSDFVSATQVCNECGEAFHSLAALSLHRLCHDFKEEPQEIQTEKDQEVLPTDCACPRCGESLESLLNSLPFKCTLCTYQNEDQALFFEHLKEHYGFVVDDVTAEREIIIMDHEVPVIDEDTFECQVDSQSTSDMKDGLIQVINDISNISKNDDPVEIPKSDGSGKSPLQKLLNLEDLDEEDCRSSDDLLKLPPSDRDVNLDFSDEQKSEVVKKKIKSEIKTVHKKERSSRKKDDKNIKPTCPMCNKTYSGRDSLRVHMRIHSGEKRFQCGHCERKFTQYTTLKYHIISLHTGAKNYSCEFCGKRFARSNSLIIHKRLHTGERDFACEYCDKTFRCSGHLRTHRRLHTGEKPYSCEVCHKRFRINADMKRHRNSVHFKLGRSLSNVPSIVYVNNEDIVSLTEEGCEVLTFGDQGEPLQVAISSIEHIGANYEL